jgi:hypothetical protein
LYVWHFQVDVCLVIVFCFVSSCCTYMLYRSVPSPSLSVSPSLFISTRPGPLPGPYS